MQINKINNITNFGRAIKVYSDSAYQSSNDRIDKSTYEVGKLLNSEPVKKYSNKQASKIRTFFKSVLEDYNGENGILLRRSRDGDIILLSGQDAGAVKHIEEKFKHHYYINPQNAIYKEIDNRLLNEKRNNKNKEIKIEFKSDTLKDTGLILFNKFVYSVYSNEYGIKRDGSIKPLDKDTELKRGTKTVYKASYDEKSVEI